MSRLHIANQEVPFVGRSISNASQLSVCSPLSHLRGLLWRRELHERQTLASVGVVHDLDVYGRRAHPLLKELHQVALRETLHALQRHRAALGTNKIINTNKKNKARGEGAGERDTFKRRTHVHLVYIHSAPISNVHAYQVLGITCNLYISSEAV